MPTLTDEQKAKAILGTVDDSQGQDEIPGDKKPDVNEDEQEVETEEQEEENLDGEKPQNGEDNSDKPVESSFTKQFPNLKGDTLEDYNTELESAYDNSFKESLRLFEENKQLKAELAQAKQVQPAQTQVDQNGLGQQVQQTPAQTQLDPVTASLLEDVKAERSRTMLSAFDDFKKDYPQALEQANFDAFTKASDGVNAALTATLGYKPSWQQLFKGVAGSLGWEPYKDTSRRDAVIKENASSTRAGGGQSAAQPKRPKVSDAQIDIYLKMYASKTREEAIKELSEVV